MKENWDEIVEMSMEIALFEAEQHPEYAEATKTVIELLEKSQTGLTFQEMSELEDAFMRRNNLKLRNVYEKGLQDGNYLFSKLNKEECH